MSEKKHKLGLLTNKLLELDREFQKEKQRIEIANKKLEEKEARVNNALSQFLNETIEGISKEIEMIDSINLDGDEKYNRQIKEHTNKIKGIIEDAHKWNIILNQQLSIENKQ